MIGDYVRILQMFLMHTKFPATVMVLGVVKNEGHVMPPHFFPQRLRVNAAAYIEVLEAVVEPWIDSVHGERPYVFQQDSAPSHKAMTTQDWMSENLHDHITPNMWLPSSPDLNPWITTYGALLNGRPINIHIIRLIP